MTKKTSPDRRTLQWWEISRLQDQGCRADDWTRIAISENTDLSRIRNVRFCGDVSIGTLGAPGAEAPGELDSATLRDCRLGNEVTVRHVAGQVQGCVVGDGAVIENTPRIEFDPEAPCGLLTQVCVLDETGSRPVRIYPGLSAQTAWLAAHHPRWAEDHLEHLLDQAFGTAPAEAAIGPGAVIRDSGAIKNVTVGRDVHIEGARSLKNGMIINNAPNSRGIAYIGPGVDADGFIIEDGRVDSGSLLRNCYVGQGVVVDKNFTAHDTLMFANTSLENGEACAVMAGPYTVSMHKASLLIGCETSFMNAGSGTNQSNHMYKLGPVHWGIMQRGVKTASSSYAMWGAKIGAFSLLMGVHKNHPDASEFPFSYLFGDEKGATIVVPGMMLRSCGLLRDEKKWPMRDRRLKPRLPLHDRVTFPVLNPVTIAAMLRSTDIIDSLLQRGVDDDLFIRYKGMKFRAPGLDRAKRYYTLAIARYLQTMLGDAPFPTPQEDLQEEWIDVGGQIVTREDVSRAMEADSLEELEQVFTDAAEHYEERQMNWIARTFAPYWSTRRELIREFAAQFDALTDDDRTAYRRSLSEELAMLTEGDS